MGRIEAICISEKKGTPKTEITETQLIQNFGVENDAHGGNWHRQVSLLSLEQIELFRREYMQVEYGAFGENLVVSGFDLKNFPIGTIFRVKNAFLQITQIGKECHTHCAIHENVGKCIMPVEGVFARVIKGGKIEKGNDITLLSGQPDLHLSAAVVTLSDRCFRGERDDGSGAVILEMLMKAGYRTEEYLLLPDDKEGMKKEFIRLADEKKINLILTTGGTGLSKRDHTPEATMEIAERNVPGIAEAIRACSVNITLNGMLSRGCSVQRGQTLIINLPGSEKAVAEITEYLLPVLEHALKIAEGTADN